MDERMKVSTGSSWEPIVGYSREIRVGNRVEVAGTTAMKESEVVGENDAYQQTLYTIKIIKDSPEKVGAKLSDVIRPRMLVVDISIWEEIGKAHGEFLRTFDQ